MLIVCGATSVLRRAKGNTACTNGSSGSGKQQPRAPQRLTPVEFHHNLSRFCRRFPSAYDPRTNIRVLSISDYIGFGDGSRSRGKAGSILGGNQHCLSIQPSPASDTSAFSRIRALVSNCVDRLPELSIASSFSRSSGLKVTIYFLFPALFPVTNHLRPHAAAPTQRARNAHKFQGRRRLASLS
jgi:hypothetical protein